MKRLTYEFVKGQFEKEGYELISTEYINNSQKLEYICPMGHRHSIIWRDWKQGCRCSYCANRPPINIEFIRAVFEAENCILLTKRYINAKQKLEYICPNGHKHSVTWGSWSQGARCAFCAGNAKLNIDFIRIAFKKEGYTLLTKEYINSKQKLEYTCSKGHKHYITWANWTSGKRCPYCVGLAKLTIEFIRFEFEREDYILLTKGYTNAHQKLKFICPNGHTHKITWNNWQQGQRCSYCIGRISKGEVEVRNFIESLEIKVLANNKNQIVNPATRHGLELDIWMPNISKAIEYNGEYWHNRSEAINKDALKQRLCKQGDIDLLVVWDYEWLSNNNACKNKIKKFVMGL